jgi:hypothetical protein
MESVELDEDAWAWLELVWLLMKMIRRATRVGSKYDNDGWISIWWISKPLLVVPDINDETTDWLKLFSTSVRLLIEWLFRLLQMLAPRDRSGYF